MQILLNGIIVGGIYALIALGFNLIYSSVRFYHLFYGILAALGVYLTRELMEVGLNFWLGAPVAAVATGLLGMLMWQFVYKPLVDRNASDLILLVTSFGALIVLQNLIAMIWKHTTLSLSIVDTIKPGYEFLGATITFNQLVILLTSIVFVIALELFLGRSKWGMAIRAIGDNPELTTTLGLKTNRIILMVFFIGSFMATIAASLIAVETGIKPISGMFFILKAIIASIIGGIGSVRGALLGGLLLGIVENIGIFVFGASWTEVTAFGLLTVFLLFRPQGLIAKYQLAK